MHLKNTHVGRGMDKLRRTINKYQNCYCSNYMIDNVNHSTASDLGSRGKSTVFAVVVPSTREVERSLLFVLR